MGMTTRNLGTVRCGRLLIFLQRRITPIQVLGTTNFALVFQTIFQAHNGTTNKMNRQRVAMTRSFRFGLITGTRLVTLVGRVRRPITKGLRQRAPTRRTLFRRCFRHRHIMTIRHIPNSRQRFTFDTRVRRTRVTNFGRGLAILGVTFRFTRFEKYLRRHRHKRRGLLTASNRQFYRLRPITGFNYPTLTTCHFAGVGRINTTNNNLLVGFFRHLF